jgi:hypothetical protein
MYLKPEIRAVRREFLAFKYLFNVLFETNQTIILFVHQNLENSRLNPVFRYTISICICVGRWRILNEYYVVEKFSDVQNHLVVLEKVVYKTPII